MAYFCGKILMDWIMEYELKYSLALDRCKMLSSYEGRDAVGESGDSLYLNVKITEQDEPLIRKHLEDAARALEEQMARMIVSAAYNDDGFVWELRTDMTRWNKLRAFGGNVLEAVVSHAMSEWLTDKVPARTEMYKNLFTDMGKMAVNNLFAKMPPQRLKREEYRDVCEIEVVENN